ncbi:hypothetical protein PB2503_04147 [Parvularcula bermudensis HTCC2503]|uniref:Peptidase A2 domain-containing protein n=1 Tax=Parvularcula bermudensis (strain ATCC BAA-594 / HTCC2503 / KCTC 12087) TaxID=314260 RepID=E0TEM1_PARBH|nr:retropepsin-like aspartic protease [Parvularcula bermudensis]ADM08904.1 hypothetical protein PB2503_04147 [Parvularcula bermudensis HTCC2503]
MERHAGFIALLVVGGVIALIVSRSVDSQGRVVIGGAFDARPPVVVTGDGAIGQLLIPQHFSGSYLTEVTISGTPIEVMVDTGASYFTLRESDAIRAGINPPSAAPRREFRTANGTVTARQAGPVSVQLGPTRLDDVTVYVLADDRLGISLLGMNVLNRFQAFSFSDRGLIIDVN